MVPCKPLIFGLIYQSPLISISGDTSGHLQVVVCVLGEASRPFFFQRGSKLAVEGLDGSLCYLALWEGNLGKDWVAFLDTGGYNLYLYIIISPFAWMAT